jgi:hypothetical protein
MGCGLSLKVCALCEFAHAHALRVHCAGDITRMTASLDIRTGTRSVLKYLAKPVFKSFGGALSER